MPEGIVATVEDGFATIDFVDTALRGPALNQLIQIGGPESIETITRRGPRRQYRVAEGNAREAGLIDDSNVSAPVVSAGVDTGASAALVDADPNRGASVAGADGPGARGPVDFHTPVAEHSSGNAFVGQVSNAEVLAGRPQVHTGDGSSSGGSGATALHSEVVGHVLDNSHEYAVGGVVPAASTAVRAPELPAAVIANALGTQTAAVGSDPGGYAIQPSAPIAATPIGAAKAQGEEVDTRPAGLPAGEPSLDWKRWELESYAEWIGVEAPLKTLTTKQALLEAIEAASAEKL